MIVILSPTAQLAADTLSLDNPPSLTVEAEYGAFVCEGTRYTSAHHQPVGSDYVGRHVHSEGRPAPCNDENIPVLSEHEVALISHLDLDTIGGLMRASGKYVSSFSDHSSFWDLAEKCDVEGVHVLDEDDPYYFCLMGILKEIKDSQPEVDGKHNIEVSSFVSSISEYISDALSETASGVNYEKGLRFVQGEKELNLKTFQYMTPLSVIIRRSPEGDFCNHLYSDPDGIKGVAVISYNEKWKSITMSLADSVGDFSCREVAQELWGDEAGGHKNIAGSPRKFPMNEEQFYQAVSYFTDRLIPYLYEPSRQH